MLALIGVNAWALQHAITPPDEALCCVLQVQHALARMKHGQLYSAFEGWRANAAEARAMQVRLERALRMWRKHLLASAYAGWGEHAALRRITRQMCAGIVHVL